mmetsp:Transcript_7668/g.15637  ORF Transcript_7668/g.15637 Transcript_7668/m.15637 type:complete len:594 (-) Transcript_7668:67-1848(-)
MRIITGDECGLLKEVIPELSRPTATTENGGGGGASIHSGNARPSATSIQAAAAAQMMQQGGSSGVVSSSSAVRKIEESEGQSRERGVISMAFVPSALNNDNDVMEDDTSSFQFATLRMNGVVQLWTGSRSTGNEEGHVTPATYRQVGVCQNVFQDITTSGNKSDEENENNSSDNTTVTGWNAHQPIRPIAMVSSRKHDITSSSSSNSNNPILACADSMGNISILNSHNLQKGVVSTYNAFELSTNQIIQAQNKANIKSTTSNNAVLTYTKGRYANTAICTALELCSGGNRLAIGGRERGVRVLDLESGKLLWKAKNLPPDPQTLLQQPQWTTCIQSITMNSNTEDLLATGTAYKQVQIFDIRESSSTRRPVLYTPEGLFTHRITTICQLQNTNTTLAVGDSTGDCHLVDIRRMHSGKQFSARKQIAKEEIGLGRLVGPGGSIRELVSHPTLPYLACVGLDRKLWTWDVSKRKMMDCVYLKQRLNSALFCADDCWSADDAKNDEDDGVADEEVEYDEPDEEWNNKRERELEGDQDEVEDYIDSDDDDGGDNNKQDSGDETASDSEEDDDDEDGSSSSEEEEEEPTPKTGKRQKR